MFRRLVWTTTHHCWHFTSLFTSRSLQIKFQSSTDSILQCFYAKTKNTINITFMIAVWLNYPKVHQLAKAKQRSLFREKNCGGKLCQTPAIQQIFVLNQDGAIKPHLVHALKFLLQVYKRVSSNFCSIYTLLVRHSWDKLNRAAPKFSFWMLSYGIFAVYRQAQLQKWTCFVHAVNVTL